jgi:hypothetical protein
VSVFIYLLTYIIFLKKNIKLRIIILGTIIAVLTCIILLFFFRKNHFIQSIPGLAKLLNTTTESNTAKLRLLSWQGAVDAWLDKPLTGWGINNFNLGFNANYPKEFDQYDLSQSWVDNAHNIFLNTIAEQGIIGLIIYLVVITFILIELYKAYDQKKIKLNLFLMLLAYFASHLIQNIFIFERHSSYLFLFTILGILDRFVPTNKKKFGIVYLKFFKKFRTRRIIHSLAIVLILFVVLFLLTKNIKILYSSHLAYLATIKINKRSFSISESFSNIKTASEIQNPFLGELIYYYTNMMMDNLVRNRKLFKEKKRKEIFRYLISSMKKNIKDHPRDIRFHIIYGKISIISCELFKECTYLKSAKKMIIKAKQLSPLRSQLIFILSDIYLIEGRFLEAVNILEVFVNKNPKLASGWINLLKVHAYSGNMKKMKESYQILKKKKLKFKKKDNQLLNLLLNRYKIQ